MPESKRNYRPTQKRAVSSRRLNADQSSIQLMIRIGGSTLGLLNERS
jgi:hypothetical protein